MPTDAPSQRQTSRHGVVGSAHAFRTTVMAKVRLRSSDAVRSARGSVHVGSSELAPRQVRSRVGLLDCLVITGQVGLHR